MNTKLIPAGVDKIPFNGTFPIGVRTRNRVAYLDLTLRSLKATYLPEGCPVHILDDCSDDEITNLYYDTDQEIVLPEPVTFPRTPLWVGCAGKMPDITKITGIKGKYDIIKPKERKGVRGGIYWCVKTMMEKYPEAEAIIVVEADVVFKKSWYKASSYAYHNLKGIKGPNGNDIGIVTAYNRKGGKVKNGRVSFGFRSISKIGNTNRWKCGNGISGQMYLVSRKMYEAGIADFEAKYDPNKRSGDTAFQGTCAGHGYNIGSLTPSLIQHIGIASSAWPEKGWRHAKSFEPPFAIEKVL